MDELVSIIIPVYCAEEYIKDTLESVRKQTYSNWELLLVADGEQDSTIPVIEEYIQKTLEEAAAYYGFATAEEYSAAIGGADKNEEYRELMLTEMVMEYLKDNAVITETEPAEAAE